MKKLATKTRAWKDSSGTTHITQKAAIQATADLKLADLFRRIGAAIPSVPQRHTDRLYSAAMGIPLGVRQAEGAVFLTVASWFKENPELVRMLTNYDASNSTGKVAKPADYPDYLKTRKKNGAVWESYLQWWNRIGSTMNISEPAPIVTDTFIEPVKVNEDTRPERSVLGNVAKSDSKYPA